MYHVDGLGFLGHSADLCTYTLNSDVYYFEQSDDGRLIVTPIYGRVQPALRVLTEDKVEFVSESRAAVLGVMQVTGRVAVSNRTRVPSVVVYSRSE